MLNKELIIRLYNDGYSLSDLAREHSVSRQRIYQVVKNYKNTGRHSRRNKYIDFGNCQECENRSVALHHIDYNNENDLPSNLIALCNKCHIKKHLNRKRVRHPSKRFEPSSIRILKTYDDLMELPTNLILKILS